MLSPPDLSLHSHNTLLQTLTFTTALLISVTVFADAIVATDNAHAVVKGGTIRLVDMDLPTTLESELSTNLPPDPVKAQSIILQRLTPDLTARMTKAHQDVADAWSMGITKIPAVVVDQKYVVYGETNVQRALDRIQAYREANP